MRDPQVWIEEEARKKVKSEKDAAAAVKQQAKSVPKSKS